MSREERKLDAAEYVIGTLTAVERSAFEVSIENDDETRNDVLFWERAFGALNASVSPEPVDTEIWARIERSLPLGDEGEANVTIGTGGELSSNPQTRSAMDSDPSNPISERPPEAPFAGEMATHVGIQKVNLPDAANDNVVEKIRRSMKRWRMGAIAASIAALGLGAFLANDRLNVIDLPGQKSPSEQLANGSQGQEFVAVVNANGDQPSLVVNVNTQTGEVSVRSIGVQRPEGKSLELWYVPEGQKAVSVGLVGESPIDLKDITAKGGDLFAISLEPQGGSPTGTATGPVIYTGKLVKAE